MLGEILAALTRNQAEDATAEVEYIPIKVPDIFPNNLPNIFPNKFRNSHPGISDAVWHVGSLLNNTPGASAEQIGKALDITGRTVRHHIAKLRELGIAERVGSNKTGYWRINLPEQE